MSHEHHHRGNFGRAFAIGIGLNLAFLLVEAGFGLASNSLALLADAGHNLTDVLGLVVAWVAVVLGRARPTPRFTYGLRRSSILSALFNAILVLLAAGAVTMEALGRLRHPVPVASQTVIVVAAIGIVINALTALLFARGRHTDLNLRGAFVHMSADAAVSAGVVAAGLVIRFTGATWIDPVVSLVIVAVIVVSTWGLLREAVAMSLDAVPAGVDPHAVVAHLAGLPGVALVHDLHIWSMSTAETALTAHLVRPASADDDQFLREAAASLGQRFGIVHTTLQIERAASSCDLASPERV